MQDLHDLALIIDSHIPLVVLETHDESHARDLLSRVAIKAGRTLYTWSITEGMRNGSFHIDAAASEEHEDPVAVLKAIKNLQPAAVIALFDFHPYMHGQPAIVRHIKDIALAYTRLGHTLVFVSHSLDLAPEIKRFSAHFDISLPGPGGLATILREELRAWMSENDGQRPAVDPEAMQSLLDNLQGITGQDARRLLRAAIRDDGAICREDVKRSNRAKFELLGLGGLLHFEEQTRQMSEVGGLEGLKAWLKPRRQAFLSQDPDLARDRPRGIMLTGVQGSGKSLAAKAVAGSWNVPLLRLDMAALYNKYIGETEKNLRHCLQQAEAMAPCVLWLDEVEKGLAVSGEEGATSHRLLGSLLTWLAERDHAVFLVMTANDIRSLPAELLRKGRLDEIFFVDLPTSPVRAEIFRLHLAQRSSNPSHFDLDQLAACSANFSGAEIEQAVVSAIHIAEARQLPLSTEQLIEELERTRPLAHTLAEQVNALRNWAEDRTVHA